MDPVTLALQALNTALEIWKLNIEGQPPDVRAEMARMQFEDFKAWRDFWRQFIPKPPQSTP